MRMYDEIDKFCDSESLSLEYCQDLPRDEEVENSNAAPHFASVDRHHENNIYLAKKAQD